MGLPQGQGDETKADKATQGPGHTGSGRLPRREQPQAGHTGRVWMVPGGLGGAVLPSFLSFLFFLLFIFFNKRG